MKKIFLIGYISSAILFFACNKENKEKSKMLFPLVPTSVLPQSGKVAPTLKYPETNIFIWFNKDGVAFSAYFKTPANIEKLAEFANNGSFIKEEIETNQNKQHEDNTGTVDKLPGGGCECEIHSGGD